MLRGEERVLTQLQKYGDGKWHETFEKAQEFVFFKTGVWIEKLEEQRPSFEPGLTNWREPFGYYVREFEPTNKPRRLVEIDGELPVSSEDLSDEAYMPRGRELLAVVAGRTPAASAGSSRPETDTWSEYDEAPPPRVPRIRPSSHYGEVRQFVRMRNYIKRHYGPAGMLQIPPSLNGETVFLGYRQDLMIQVEARQGKELDGKKVCLGDEQCWTFEEAQRAVLGETGIWIEHPPDFPPPSVERVGKKPYEIVAYYVREFKPNDTPRALVEIRGQLPRRNEDLIPEVAFGNRRLVLMPPEIREDETSW
jgi:hypothetical protein